ncbi:MAG: hypothetical protein JOZ69_08685 [Myxococcales bacterium]|nr:hypothetical protein [Myxococcales bacterium]
MSAYDPVDRPSAAPDGIDARLGAPAPVVPSWGSAARWKAHAQTWGPVTLALVVLAREVFSAVVAKVGHAAAPLDDAYIHFQYARAIAEGHPLRFQAGEPISSGATSWLWPVLLAPFYAVGARGDAIVWPAWAFAFLALGGLAWEAAALTRGLAGRAAAIGAGAMVLSCGGLVWSAASGMEVVPFAWTIARAARRSAEWAEAGRGADRTPARAGELAALAWAAALFRPEGTVTAIFVAITLVVFAGRAERAARAAGALAAAGAAAPFVLLWLLTGTARSSTAIVKLLPGNPYYAGGALVAAVRANVVLLAGTLLDGQIWSAEFLPGGGALLAFAGLAAVVWRGARTRSGWRAGAVLLLAATMFAPCAYVTFLWNRLRYLWPFASGWLVGLACLARTAGDLAGMLRPRWRAVTPLACGVFVGLLASKLGWVMEDVSQSASGIDRQQVALGRWARENLPEGARIGVNDTGAIAYFGDRRTFDVVGLTTPEEARYWVAGPASRLEHYERLAATAPQRLPTHFIVYPEWMALDAVLGAPLHEATVTDATILGGRTMRAYEADWSALGSGERPWTRLEGALVDVLDVADLESEAAHAYELLGARDGEQVAREGHGPHGEAVLDGGRSQRSRERFVAHLRAGAPARLLVRMEGAPGTRLTILAGGEAVGQVDDFDPSDWVERRCELPARVASARTEIEVRAAGPPVTVYHYWFVQ